MIEILLEKKLNEVNKTMYWLSKQTGISANAISKLVNNETKSINFETLYKIYSALDCKSFDELFYIPKKEL